MKLTVLSSGSIGNCYILESSTGKKLIIEAGISYKQILKEINHDVGSVVGCVISHEHGDHFKSAHEISKAGIDCVMSKGTFESKNSKCNPHRVKIIKHGQKITLGEFEVVALDAIHDAAEPLMFLIKHHESGVTAFITDTMYLPYVLPGVNNWLIEANFCEDIISERHDSGYLLAFLRDRIFKSHLSLRLCKEFLAANDLRKTNNIILVHLSASNSDAERFKSEVRRQTLKKVHIAEPGLEVNFNLNPYS